MNAAWAFAKEEKGNPEERAVLLGQYIVQYGATMRGAAQVFGISKSTVHTKATN